MNLAQNISQQANYFALAKWSCFAANDSWLAYTIGCDCSQQSCGIRSIPGGNNNPSSINDSATTESIDFQYDVHGCTSVAGTGCAGATGPDQGAGADFCSCKICTSAIPGGRKTYIGNFMVLTKVYLEGGSGYSADLSYLHKDHLGSTDAITTGHSTGSGTDATEEGRMLFDPFGKRRKDNGADEDATYKATLAERTFETTTKGYTGHEQLDSVGLIHMGGRVYDPYIGRFLSPDEHVQYPEFTQSYNRYSYVLNNPLSKVEPTGEEDNPVAPKQKAVEKKVADSSAGVNDIANTDSEKTALQEENGVNGENIQKEGGNKSEEDADILIDPTFVVRRIPDSETFFSPVYKEDGDGGKKIRTLLSEPEVYAFDLSSINILKGAIKKTIVVGDPFTLDVGWTKQRELEIFQ